MKLYLPILLVSLFGCRDNSKLHPVCGNFGQGKCYAVKGITSAPNWWNDQDWAEARKFAGVGVCQFGTPTCDAEYNIIACEGEGPLPSSELCDGLDNNCNGYTDEDYKDEPLEAYVGENNVCGNFGECKKYHSTCVNGKWECPYTPQPEVCDNKDNDCNNIVDDNAIEEQLCFEDEFWKVTNGNCRAGVTRCIHGQSRCDEQVLPSPERCDNEDNDCNGIIDDTGEVLSSQYDIVFVVDTSGSMCSYIGAVAAALSEYIAQFEGNTNFRWALVGMSEMPDPLIQVLADFTTISALQSLLLNLDCNGSGMEASLDVLYDTCSHIDGPLGLSWNTSANALVFSFTDELPQTYRDPQTDGLMITDACLEHGVLPFQWSLHPSLFGPIVTDANGQHFDIVNSWEQIFEDLNSIIITLCGG